MRPGLGQDRRRRQRTIGCRASQVFRASAHSSTIRLPNLRNHPRSADSAGGDQRWHGGGRIIDLGDDRQIPGSPAAVPAGTNRRSGRGDLVPFHLGRLGGRLGVALQPLADRLAWHLRQRDSLHADETPVPQLDPGNGKTKKAYLWAYRSNDLQPGPKIIVFDYQAGRSGRYAQQFLGTGKASCWSMTTLAIKSCLRPPVRIPSISA